MAREHSRGPSLPWMATQSFGSCTHFSLRIISSKHPHSQSFSKTLQVESSWGRWRGFPLEHSTTAAQLFDFRETPGRSVKEVFLNVLLSFPSFSSCKPDNLHFLNLLNLWNRLFWNKHEISFSWRRIKTCHDKTRRLHGNIGSVNQWEACSSILRSPY